MPCNTSVNRGQAFRSSSGGCLSKRVCKRIDLDQPDLNRSTQQRSVEASAGQSFSRVIIYVDEKSVSCIFKSTLSNLVDMIHGPSQRLGRRDQCKQSAKRVSPDPPFRSIHNAQSREYFYRLESGQPFAGLDLLQPVGIEPRRNCIADNTGSLAASHHTYRFRVHHYA